ncbi:MAG: DUF4382 domain-containing protein [Nitrospirae bacterium]|nr:DUF4382 domain-containing protein [Nitrospirota bacterium]
MRYLMNYFTRIARAPWLGALVGLFGLIALAACGGPTAGGDSTAGGATVTLAMTDAPSDAFEAVTVTVDSATLIGSTGSFSIPFPDGAPITLNVLELDGINWILATAAVPAGTYSKVRLQVSHATVTWPDGTEETLTLVADGKVDLNFQGTIELGTHDASTIQLDFSAEDSIKLTETGTGKLILRPQIFINTTARAEDGDTPHIDDLAGVITEIDATNRTLALDVRSGLRPTVVVTDETSIVSDEGPGAFTDLTVGMYIQVEGTLDEHGRVVASIVHIAPERHVVSGLVTHLDPSAGTLVLLHPDQSTTTVAFDEQTRVYFLWHALTTGDLANGQIVHVGGTIDPADASGTLHARVIRIRPDRFAGIITDASGCADGTLAVRIGPQRLLARLAAAGITLSPENTIVVERSTELGCPVLSEGTLVRVWGRLVPHVPDSSDSNPVRFHAARMRLIIPHHVTGAVVEVTPTPGHPNDGTFVVETGVAEKLFSDADGVDHAGRITVVVTPRTQFHDALQFSQDLVGQRVIVLGVYVGARPRVALVATHVLLANP